MPESYIFVWDEKRKKFVRDQVRPYVPDPDARPSDYKNLKPGEVDLGHGQIVEAPAEWFHEFDYKVAVDHTKLLLLPQPWIIVQGYWVDPTPDIPGGEMQVSLRVMPAQQISWFRIKSAAKGRRKKTRIRIPYDLAEHMIYQAPGVAVKYRFLKRDDKGRAWLVEYFPDFNWWQAETETEDESQAGGGAPPYLPDWAGEQLVDESWGYTHTRAIPRSATELATILKDAENYGTREPYEPGSGKPFNWVAT